MSPNTAGHVAMLLFSALVAGSFSLGAIVANDIAGIPRKAAAAPWRYLLLGGMFATYFVLMFEGLKTAEPVSASAVFTLTPILSALFGYLLLRQITTPRMALALAIGGAGALWVIFRADLAALLAFHPGKGEIIYFWGCVAHAAYTPMVRKLNRGEPAVVFTFGMLLAGCLLLTLYGWNDILATDWLHLRPSSGSRSVMSPSLPAPPPSSCCSSPPCACLRPRSWPIPISPPAG